MAQNRNMTANAGDDVGGGIFTVISVAVLVGTEIIVVQEGVPAVIPPEAC